jgi:hypothetical protein
MNSNMPAAHNGSTPLDPTNPDGMSTTASPSPTGSPSSDKTPSTDPETRSEAVPPADAVSIAEAAIDSTSASIFETLRLSLRIIPAPTQGIATYARSRPWVTSWVLLSIATLVYPIGTWISKGLGNIAILLTGLLSILLAHMALGLVLTLMLRVYFGRKSDLRELFAVFAACQIPFIPLVTLGTVVELIKPNMFMALVMIGIVLATEYLRAALRELYQLGSDAALYGAAFCYAVWVIVFYAGLRG